MTQERERHAEHVAPTPQEIQERIGCSFPGAPRRRFVGRCMQKHGSTTACKRRLCSILHLIPTLTISGGSP